MDVDPPEPFGPALRRLRLAAGVSLAALARQVHYSKGYLSKVETGRARGTAQLAVLCDVVLDTGGDLAARASVLNGPAGDAGVDSSRFMIEHALSMLIALDLAHNELRHVARGDPNSADRHAASLRAVQAAGLYTAREHLLVSGSTPLVKAGETAFRLLIGIRNEVREGADLESAAYHRAFHAYADALWSYRMTIRAELGQTAFTPEQLDLADWSDRDRCSSCR